MAITLMNLMLFFVFCKADSLNTPPAPFFLFAFY